MTRALAFIHETRGAAAAEMALMLPLLLILIFVGFEAGHYFYTEHKVIKAVREGARYAGRQPWGYINCNDPIDADAESRIKQVTLTGTLTGTVPRIPGMELGDITVTRGCDPNFEGDGIFKGTADGAPLVLVQARTAYPSLFEQLGLLDSSFQVQASAEAVVNGI